MTYRLHYSDYSTTAEGPPNPAAWVGPPGPPGPPGPMGPAGGIILGGPLNVLDYGADPTGVADSTAAIRAALAIRPAKSVYLPAGSYRLTDSLTVGAGNVSQTLYGDGQASVLLVNTDFNPAALGVVILTGAQAPLATHPVVEHLTIQFAVPPDATATLASASGTTLNLTGPVPASVVVGDYATDDTDWAGIQANSTTMNANPPIEGSKVVSIGTNSVVISLPVVAGHIAAGHSIRFGHTRSMFRNLGAAPPPSTSVGGYGAKYPWAIYADGAGLPLIDNVKINGAWNGIWCHPGGNGGNFRITNCPIGAMNVGTDIDGGGDGGFMENIWYNAYGIYVPAFLTNTCFGQVWYDGTTKSYSIGKTDGIFMSNIGSFNCISEIKATWSFGQMVNIDQDFPSAQFIIGAHTGLLQITNFRGQRVTMNGGAAFINFLIDGSAAPAPFLAINGSFQPTFSTGAFNGGPGGIVVTGAATPHIRDCVFIGPATSWSGGLVQVQSGCTISLHGCEFVTSGVGPGLTLAIDSQWANVTDNYWGNCTFTPPGSAGVYQAGLPATQGGIVAAGTTQGTATPLTAPISNVSTVGAGSGVILPAWAATGSRWVVWNRGANALLVYIPAGNAIFGIGASQSVAVNGQIVLLRFDASTWFVEA